MNLKQNRTYSQEFKDQVVKECRETGEAATVAKKFDLPPTTVYGWIGVYNKSKGESKGKKNMKKLEKELAEARLENSILKELLKKTNQLWLKN